mmetsp:Transcript_27353/g.87636  ORF Transcript_27353/g.87636 Transcript_27353/m.87636 type:complete len:383 (-) Transcript_27353:417-1565(-)
MKEEVRVCHAKQPRPAAPRAGPENSQLGHGGDPVQDLREVGKSRHQLGHARVGACGETLAGSQVARRHHLKGFVFNKERTAFPGPFPGIPKVRLARVHAGVARGRHVRPPEEVVPLGVHFLQCHDICAQDTDIFQRQLEAIVGGVELAGEVRVEGLPSVRVLVSEHVVGAYAEGHGTVARGSRAGELQPLQGGRARGRLPNRAVHGRGKFPARSGTRRAALHAEGVPHIPGGGGVAPANRYNLLRLPIAWGWGGGWGAFAALAPAAAARLCAHAEPRVLEVLGAAKFHLGDGEDRIPNHGAASHEHVQHGGRVDYNRVECLPDFQGIALAPRLAVRDGGGVERRCLRPFPAQDRYHQPRGVPTALSRGIGCGALLLLLGLPG